MWGGIGVYNYRKGHYLIYGWPLFVESRLLIGHWMWLPIWKSNIQIFPVHTCWVPTCLVWMTEIKTRFGKAKKKQDSLRPVEGKAHGLVIKGSCKIDS